MSAVFTVSALFGCGGSGKYTVDDIISFHTSCCGMESNPVYAFALRKQDESWLFSASCWVKSREDCYTSFSSFPIPTEEAEKFLEIIREEDPDAFVIVGDAGEIAGEGFKPVRSDDRTLGEIIKAIRKTGDKPVSEPKE